MSLKRQEERTIPLKKLEKASEYYFRKKMPISKPTLGCKGMTTVVDNWKEILFIHQADRPYQYLYIGNFSRQLDLNTKYFFIDLV